MGLASGLCQYITTRAVFFAPVASIAPIKYTAMLWAIIIGYIWFGDIPTIWVLIGSSIVILATLIILRTPGKRPETAVES
jgi:drug/metabolite transporter (DMT)-like permease